MSHSFVIARLYPTGQDTAKKQAHCDGGCYWSTWLKEACLQFIPISTRPEHEHLNILHFICPGNDEKEFIWWNRAMPTRSIQLAEGHRWFNENVHSLNYKTNSPANDDNNVVQSSSYLR